MTACTLQSVTYFIHIHVSIARNMHMLTSQRKTRCYAAQNCRGAFVIIGIELRGTCRCHSPTSFAVYSIVYVPSPLLMTSHGIWLPRGAIVQKFIGCDRGQDHARLFNNIKHHQLTRHHITRQSCAINQNHKTDATLQPSRLDAKSC